VAIIRLRSLGDCVLTTPALDLLKRFRPDLHLAVVVEPRFRAVFEGNPDVGEILPPATRILRRWRPDLCLNFHGGSRSAWMTVWSGAQFRAGFAHFRRQFAYNVRIPAAQAILNVNRKVHTAEHLASAMFYLGVPPTEIPRARLFPAVEALGPSQRRIAVIHPAASQPSKTWPAVRFLAIATHLREQGLEPVFVGSSTDDLAPFRAFRTIAGAPLSELKRLLASATLFVGNDSGPAHMAAACGLPVVVIFGSSDPAIWGPWRTTAEIVASRAGIEEVTVSEVRNALSRLKVVAA
jgi:heptosyltransferase-3